MHMIQIAQAQYLWILALIPLLFLAYGMYRRHGKRMLKKFGDPELMKPLMPDVSPRKGWLKMVLFSLGLFFCPGVVPSAHGARVKEMKRTGWKSSSPWMYLILCWQKIILPTGWSGQNWQFLDWWIIWEETSRVNHFCGDAFVRFGYY